MVRISNIRLPVGFTRREIEEQLHRQKIPPQAQWQFSRLSLDARKKEEIHYRASVDVDWPGEREFLRRNRKRTVSEAEWVRYRSPTPGNRVLTHRPVIVGSGPAGLFAARLLAEAGYAPIVLERGAPVPERKNRVQRFWREGVLDPDSNVSFGEGGAGTFSDGKLNTQVKDRDGRIRQVLEWFVEAGAPENILYWYKPHIGTDVLQSVVQNLSARIREKGGEMEFHCRVTGLRTIDTDEGRRLTAVEYRRADGTVGVLEAEAVILAIGHGARDTFEMLEKAGVRMQPKPFAVGVRIEHPQESINRAQYGAGYPDGLPAADYRLTARTSSGRGVYSFCMCPGGQVVNASSEPDRIAVNGMSQAARDGRNANAALVVTVGPEDFGGEGALAGMAFQREWERRAWEMGEGKIPAQLLGDFRKKLPSRTLGEVEPDILGGYRLGNLREALPGFVGDALAEVFPCFEQKIAGYGREDAVLSGIESRTSSPVRILRDENFESSLRGLFPCGEGAGYAGGITSAAVDGLRTAEEIIRRYRRWEMENWTESMNSITSRRREP